jgi:hypothetical protein
MLPRRRRLRQRNLRRDRFAIPLGNAEHITGLRINAVPVTEFQLGSLITWHAPFNQAKHLYARRVRINVETTEAAKAWSVYPTGA